MQHPFRGQARRSSDPLALRRAPRRTTIRTTGAQRTLAVAAVVPAVALLAAGCGSGRHNQNYLEHTVSNGVNGTLSGLGIRNAFFARPVEAGGTATLVFSVYADDPQSATTLTSVTAPTLGNGPAQLATVNQGQTTQVRTVPIVWQQRPGANQLAAYFPGVTQKMLASTYWNVTFAFANGLSETLQVAVQQVGAADPNSTSVPTVLPEKPYTLSSAVPGEAGQPKASATATTVGESGPNG